MLGRVVSAKGEESDLPSHLENNPLLKKFKDIEMYYDMKSADYMQHSFGDVKSGREILTVKVDLGDFSDFATFNNTNTNTLNVTRRLTVEDLGLYPILIRAYSNSTGEEEL